MLRVLASKDSDNKLKAIGVAGPASASSGYAARFDNTSLRSQ